VAASRRKRFEFSRAALAISAEGARVRPEGERMFRLLISLIGAIVPICVEDRPISATHGAGKEETAERACQMFTAEQLRAKAAEFRAFLTHTPRSPNETREFRDLEQTYTTLAENEEWMAVHIDKTIQRIKNYDNRTALVEEEE